MNNNEKSFSAKAGGAVGRGLLEGGKYAADLINAGVKGVVKLPFELADMAGDAAAIGTDFTTNLVTGGHGTNIANKEGFLDKTRDASVGWIDKYGTLNASEFGKTDAGKFGIDAVEFLSGMLVPIGGTTVKLGKVYNKLKAVKGADKLVKELDTVFDVAKKGQKIEKSQIDDILKKYSKYYDASKSKLDTMTAPANYKGLNTEAKDVLNNIKKYTPEQIKELNNPRLTKLYEFFKRNPKKSIAGLLVGAPVGAGYIDEYLNGTDEGVEEFEKILDSNPEVNEIDSQEENKQSTKYYKDRELQSNANGKFQFIGVDGKPSQEFDTTESAQKYIDEQLENYYKVELQKAEAEGDIDKQNDLVKRAKERGFDIEDGFGL